MERNINDDGMRVRKLFPQEHGKTRTLWESIFSEDSSSFLDYYYQYKTAENEIYAVEDKEEIRAMLQLNPYQIHVGEFQARAHYIIAVATDPRYRKRGLMAELLRTSMHVMYERKEPFTYLMPAAEAIYYPFDFRFVYSQAQTIWTRPESEYEMPAICEVIIVTSADRQTCVELSGFAQEYLSGNYQIYAVRDARYYQVRLAELQSENGGMLLVREKGILKACCAYFADEQIEIVEPLAANGYEEVLKHAVFHTIGQQSETIKVLACTEKEVELEKPMIMARVLHLESMLKCLQAEEGLDCRIRVTDQVLTENNKTIRIFEEAGMVQVEILEAGGCDGELNIAALTGVLFGTFPFEELCEKEDVEISEQLKLHLKKITPFTKVFLNEIV